MVFRQPTSPGTDVELSMIPETAPPPYAKDVKTGGSSGTTGVHSSSRSNVTVAGPSGASAPSSSNNDAIVQNFNTFSQQCRMHTSEIAQLARQAQAKSAVGSSLQRATDRRDALRGQTDHAAKLYDALSSKIRDSLQSAIDEPGSEGRRIIHTQRTLRECPPPPYPITSCFATQYDELNKLVRLATRLSLMDRDELSAATCPTLGNTLMDEVATAARTMTDFRRFLNVHNDRHGYSAFVSDDLSRIRDKEKPELDKKIAQLVGDIRERREFYPPSICPNPSDEPATGSRVHAPHLSSSDAAPHSKCCCCSVM